MSSETFNLQASLVLIRDLSISRYEQATGDADVASCITDPNDLGTSKSLLLPLLFYRPQ